MKTKEIENFKKKYLIFVAKARDSIEKGTFEYHIDCFEKEVEKLHNFLKNQF